MGLYDGQSLDPSALKELRILVLHNRDFATSPQDDAADIPLDELSRADVANAARSIARALAARGHFAEAQGIDRDDVADLMQRLRHDPPDLVFNIVESMGGDDRHGAVIPTLLDLLEIPYTGAGPMCQNVVLRKHFTSQVLRAAGIPTPPSVLLPSKTQARSDDLAATGTIGYPLFLKLEETDGSVGVSNSSLVQTDEELVRQVAYLRDRYSQPILAERFIAGREVYVSMLGNSPARLLPMQEIDFSKLPRTFPHIVNENAKWKAGTPEYAAISSVVARPLPSPVRERIEQVVRRTFEILEVRDYGRCDIRLAEIGRAHV